MTIGVAHTLHPDDTMAHCVTEGSCVGAITFDVPLAREHFSRGPFWQVASGEPLTLSPSLLCHCGDHGHVVAGRWVPC